MKALQIERFGPIEDLQVRDVARPAPREGEVLVEIEAAGVNPSDLGVAQGKFPTATLPRILGRDFAGRVVDGPPEWKGVSVWGSGGGELGLTRDGTHAENLALPASALAKRAANLSAEQAAAMGVPFVTAWSALVDLAALSRDEVAIISGAAGSVGRAAIDVAHARGAKVIALVKDANEAAALAGSAVVAIARSDRNDLVDVTREATGGTMAGVALNAVGAPVFAPMLSSLGLGGRMVVISAAAGREVTLDLFTLYRGEFRLLGLDTAELTLSEIAGILVKLDPLIDSGALTPPSVAERYPLSRAPEAYRRVAAGGTGKVVIVPDRFF